MIIDVHGHYTTAPPALHKFRALQIGNMAKPSKAAVNISDDEIRESLENGQLKLQRERGIDLVLFSPQASAMGHHFGNALISRYWTEASNDLIHRVARLYPDRFVGVCALPESPGVRPSEYVDELERCVKELGFVGCNLNPDPSGGYWTGPPLGDEWWYPLYEKMVELEVPAMIHGSATCNPNFHTIGSHYLNVDSSAFVQLLSSNVFRDFPSLRIIVPHGGATVPFQATRYRALAMRYKWVPFEEILKQLYFDTSVYSPEAMDLLIKTVGVDNVLYASEMLGGVIGVDPDTGRAFDDNKPLVESVGWLSDADRKKIFEGNAMRAFPRLAAALNRQ